MGGHPSIKSTKRKKSIATRQLQHLYEQYFREDVRSFIHLLQYCHKHQISQNQLLETVEELSQYCPSDITVDKLMALLGNQPNQPVPAASKGVIEEHCEVQLQEMGFPHFGGRLVKHN